MLFASQSRRLSFSPRPLLCLAACWATSALASACQAADVWFNNQSPETLKVELVELPGSPAIGFADGFWEFAPGEHAYLAVNNRRIPKGNKGVFRITSRLGATLLTTSYIDPDGDLACHFRPADWNRHRALLQGAKVYVRNLSAEPKRLRLTSLTDTNAQHRNTDYVFEIAGKQQGYLHTDGQPLLATGVRYAVSDGARETTASADAANLDDDGDLVLALGTVSAPARNRGSVVTQDEEKLQSAMGKIIVAAIAHAVATADAEPTFANQFVQELARAARREAVASAMEDVFPGLSAAERTVIVRVTCDALDEKFDANNVHNMREIIVRTLKAERPDLDDAVDVADIIAQIAIAARQQRK